MPGKTRRLIETVLDHRGQISRIFVANEDRVPEIREWVIEEVPGATLDVESGDVVLPDGRRVVVKCNSGGR